MKLERYCFVCKKEFPFDDVVMTATNNWDGTGRYMCKRCYARCKSSLGGWRGLVEGDTAVANQARAIMWHDTQWHPKPR